MSDQEMGKEKNCMDQRKRIWLEKIIYSSYKNTAGIIVLKNGNTVYENYFNEYTATSTLHVFSVTKSIISILIGIAIEKGHIKGVDQKVLEFFPDYKVKEGEKTIQRVTLKDMLTMTVPFKYKSEPYTEYFTSDNWVNSALDFLGGKGKIGEFRYAPLIGPDIFSGILVKATGQSVLDFATEHLFTPLGIHVEGNVIFRDKEEQLAWYHEKKVSGWVADPQGVNTAGFGLTLTPMDMAKIGQLYLEGGVFEDKQIVPPWWVDESTEGHSQWERLSYGYLWWVIDEKEHIFAALGDGGNVIYINGKKKIVIAMACLFAPNAKDRIKLIREYIEPIFEN